MGKLTFIMIAMVALALPLSSFAQKPVAYPAKGQSSKQQSTDDSQCLAWAKQSTGIDPAAVAATPPPPTGPQGERLRGAARGAVGGAVIGEIANDDAGKGAGVGAAAGVLAGGARSRRNQAAQAQQAQAAKTQRSTPTTARTAHACRVVATPSIEPGNRRLVGYCPKGQLWRVARRRHDCYPLSPGPLFSRRLLPQRVQP